jgi:hypothetical protein
MIFPHPIPKLTWISQIIPSLYKLFKKKIFLQLYYTKLDDFNSFSPKLLVSQIQTR